MRRHLTTTAVAAALIGLPAVVHAQDPAPRPAAGAETMKVTSAAELQWSPIQPEGFAAGMEIAVIHGDPAAADQPYTIRLRFKDGYRFPAHYHPNAENLTVLRGTFLLRMGDTSSEDLEAYGPGDFLHLPAEQPHFGGARGETEVQLHGIGPFEIMLARPVPSSPRN
ncbi:MAG TPA: cupin domain-containing protein [Longimicrobiales bacterium]